MSTTASGASPDQLEGAQARRRSRDRPPGGRSLRARGARPASANTIGAELRAIDGAVGGEDVGAEARGDRRGRFGAGRRHAVREHVGVEARHAAPPELLEHVALAGRDAAGQCDFQHRSGRRLQPAEPGRLPSRILPVLPVRSCAAVSVFFSSIAIVSGPTPPGTGVSAPATSATSGCTSPTHERAAPLERLAPLRARREQPLDDRAIGRPASCRRR